MHQYKTPYDRHRVWMQVRVLVLAFSSLLLGAAGCKSDPYCLNCERGSVDAAGTDGAPPPDLTGADLTTLPDLTGTPCTLSNGGVEICDGQDNDCNGIVDDVAPSKLAADPNNCGVCGNACNFTGQKQFGVCDASSGTPTCMPGDCVPGYFNADGNAANGCEYACTITNNGTEICDGKDNNCNGQTDEGFDTQNDPNNCGGCGISCVRPNTPGTCSAGVCAVTTCAAGYKNVDNNPANGCEYQCPVFPAVAEVCNGVDDDCDGVKDNNPTDVGDDCNNFCGTVAPCVANNTCSFPLSTCVNGCCGICNQGKTVCSGGTEVCQAGTRPALETCDGVDNNCDGQVDEGFDTQNDPLNCGGCGQACNLLNVLTYKCAAGGCGIAHNGTPGTTAYQQSGCQPGFSDLDNTPGNGCEHSCEVYPTTVEVCDGKDNDCDNLVDEPAGMTAPANFCRNFGLCSAAEPVCCGSAGWLCDYPSVNAGIEVLPGSLVTTCKQVGSGRPGVPVGTTRSGGALVFAETVCDNIDGDCKGGADDSFLQKGKPCTIGVGICAGTGNFVCGGTSNVGACAGSTSSSVCCPAAAQPGNATAEECDGKDNNCDNQIDERVADTTFLPGALAGYVDRFVQVSPTLWVYAYEASRIDSNAGNAGTASTSRACAKPNVVPWANVTQADAATACNAIVLQNGTRARLCTQAEWQTSCEGTGGAVANSYSYSTANTTYTALVCNDANRQATPAVWATGFDNGQAKKCYTDWGGAGKRLYDMSGNLMEWTSDSVTVDGKTYYKVRGGAYNSPSDGTPPDGTSCEFDFNILPTGFANSNVGFRCCADSAP